MRLLVLLLALAAFAQERPAFEVASIKANTQGELAGFSEDLAPDGKLTARNVSLRNLIRWAYGLTELQLTGGPPWIKTQGFDVVAKPPDAGAPVPRPESVLMLQRLLEERFQLKSHRESRSVPSYTLTLANGGAKLPPPSEGRNRMTLGDLDATSMTMETFCRFMEFELGRPVKNETGIEGPFAMRLQWASERVLAGAPDATKPSLFTALQEQLGLKLDSTRAPLEMFVVDSAEKPSEN